MMTQREKYVRGRLMELALMAETRKLDRVEEEEEKKLAKELALLEKGE